MDFLFFTNSILLGIALAMDAFSVSIANAIYEPKMRFSRMCLIAGCYGFFQFLMPLTGWFCVNMILHIFSAFQKFIPVIALVLLLFLGCKMLYEAFHEKGENEKSFRKLSFAVLLLQGIATSIDALSVGFTISEYDLLHALLSSLIIALVTFVICSSGLKVGKKLGEVLSGKAEILGGVILIFIGLEIFIRSLL